MNNHNTNNDSLNLLELLRPLLKWWWLLLISAVLAALSSAFYTMQQPLVYSSTTTIMVGTALSDPNPSDNEIGLAERLAIAYADIANRATIQDAVKKALNTQWLPEYLARHIQNTPLLEISVVDTIPERAQIVSQTIADQIILMSPSGQSQQGRQQFIEMQLNDIEKAITDTNAEIQRLEMEIASMFSARQIADTRAQLTALEEKRTTLQNNYATIFSNSNRSATNTVAVIEPAYLPEKPLNDDLLRNILLAAILGAAVAGAGAYLLEYSNSTIKNEEEIPGKLELVSLGQLPKFDEQPKHFSGLLTTDTMRSELSDAYAALRLNVQSVLRRDDIHTLAITCPTSEDRRPSITANLCAELARAGAKVVLIDADLHRPSQQRIFNLPNRFGLSTLLTDDTLLAEDLLQTTEIPGLSLITSGPLPANPAALIGAKRIRSIVAELRERADYVVLDVPPVNAVVDTLLLASEVDGVVLTLVAQQTRNQDIEKAIKAFQRLDVEIIGTVMSNANMQGPAHQYGYHTKPKSQDKVPPNRESAIAQKNPVQASSNGAYSAPNTIVLSPSSKSQNHFSTHDNLDDLTHTTEEVASHAPSNIHGNHDNHGANNRSSTSRRNPFFR